MSYNVAISQLNMNDILLRTGPYQYVLVDDSIDDWSRDTLSHKIGRMAGRTKNFFSKKETKVATLTAYWFVETFFYFLMMLAMNPVIFITVLLPMWIYGTYSLFSVINN